MKYQWTKLVIAGVSGFLLAWGAQAEMRGAKTMDDTIKKSKKTSQNTKDRWSYEETTWETGTETGQEMDDGQDFGRNYRSGATILRGMGMPETALEPKEPMSIRKALNKAQ